MPLISETATPLGASLATKSLHGLMCTTTAPIESVHLKTGLGKTSDQIMAAVMGDAGCGKSFFGEAVNLLI